jgi:hypothetical protein
VELNPRRRKRRSPIRRSLLQLTPILIEGSSRQAISLVFRIGIRSGIMTSQPLETFSGSETSVDRRRWRSRKCLEDVSHVGYSSIST